MGVFLLNFALNFAFRCWFRKVFFLFFPFLDCATVIGLDSRKATPKMESDLDETYRKHAKTVDIEHSRLAYLEFMANVSTYMRKQKKQSKKISAYAKTDEIEHAKCSKTRIIVSVLTYTNNKQKLRRKISAWGVYLDFSRLFSLDWKNRQSFCLCSRFNFLDNWTFK